MDHTFFDDHFCWHVNDTIDELIFKTWLSRDAFHQHLLTSIKPTPNVSMSPTTNASIKPTTNVS